VTGDARREGHAGNLAVPSDRHRRRDAPKHGQQARGAVVGRLGARAILPPVAFSPRQVMLRPALARR